MASLADDSRAATQKSESRRLLIRGFGVAWVILISLFVLWEMWNYSGLYAKMSEWQFATFRKSWPAATLGLLSLLLALPGLFFVHIARVRKLEEEPDVERKSAQHTLLTRAIFWRLLFGRASIACAILAVLCLISTLFLPGSGNQPVAITVGRETQPHPANGATTLTGRVIFAQTATLSQDLILTDKNTRFAPILPAEGSGPVRYVVQLAPYEGMTEGRPGDPVMSVSGTLMRNALPGPIRSLYSNSGIALADDVYVLYRYSGTIRRPYYLASIQLGAATLLLLLLFYVQTRHIRKLRNSFGESTNPTPAEH